MLSWQRSVVKSVSKIQGYQTRGVGFDHEEMLNDLVQLRRQAWVRGHTQDSERITAMIRRDRFRRQRLRALQQRHQLTSQYRMIHEELHKAMRMLEAIGVALAMDLEDFQGDHLVSHQEALVNVVVEDHQVGRRSHQRRRDKDKTMQH